VFRFVQSSTAYSNTAVDACPTATYTPPAGTSIATVDAIVTSFAGLTSGGLGMYLVSSTNGGAFNPIVTYVKRDGGNADGSANVSDTAIISVTPGTAYVFAAHTYTIGSGVVTTTQSCTVTVRFF
jgi:hypothetical protein